MRASLCRGKRILRQQAPAPAAADQASSARLSSADGLLRYAHVELASRLWIVRPDLVRYEREVTGADRAQRPLIVGTAARHSYYDPGVGTRSVEDPLVRGELPELHLFDPWEFVCDLELEVAGMTSCAGRQAIEAKATTRRLTTPNGQSDPVTQYPCARALRVACGQVKLTPPTPTETHVISPTIILGSRILQLQLRVE